jgi:hypothetical protein
MFFKFVLNFIFFPLRFNVVKNISNYRTLFKLKLHKFPHFDNNEDQDGSEASVSVDNLLSL